MTKAGSAAPTARIGDAGGRAQHELRLGDRGEAGLKSQLRRRVANAFYPTKAYNLPSACGRYGLDPCEQDEAYSSKTTGAGGVLCSPADRAPESAEGHDLAGVFRSLTDKSRSTAFANRHETAE